MYRYKKTSSLVEIKGKMIIMGMKTEMNIPCLRMAVSFSRFLGKENEVGKIELSC
jgi:hypothetical protein